MRDVVVIRGSVISTDLDDGPPPSSELRFLKGVKDRKKMMKGKRTTTMTTTIANTTTGDLLLSRIQ